MGSEKKPLRAWVRALERTAPIDKNPQRTLPLVIDELAARMGTASALESTGGSLTYEELGAQVRRYARWALALGLGPGDVVCLMMPNRPEYLAIWLGITRVGATVALLNTNLTGDALLHSIRVVEPKHIITDASLADSLGDVRVRLSTPVTWWMLGAECGGFFDLTGEVARMSDGRLEVGEHHAPSITDRALFIYTSGTTGLPKAANVSHGRIMHWSHWFAGLMDTSPSDRMYNCLPLYHSVGGVIATGATLVGGGAVVLRERFSASEFWRDVVAQECTLFQYIGELCRYLANGPVDDAETEHRLRLCCGNGLAPDVWERFESRFKIPRILEFYAATEGNFSLYNCEGEPGSIGRIPPFLAHRLPVEIVRFDLDTEAPLRNAEGRCERVPPNEIGEAIGRVAGDSSVGRFEGYNDPAATAKKVLNDVFEKGDRWYRTGDLMRRDERGFFYFSDRAGDTYRWKGENVSSAEIAVALGSCDGVREAVVYGVLVPGSDGRAGMAALVVDEAFDLDQFRSTLTTLVPDYARPLFLRIRPAIDVTATFKPRKQDLVSDAFDPRKVPDPLYFDDRARGAYVPLDGALYDLLQTGGVRI